MNILYIAHFIEGSGWSKAAINNVYALLSTGANVICRNIKLTNEQFEIPDEIVTCLQKEIEDIDVCIQHVLPHHLVATQLFKKNIACYCGESNTTKPSTWFNNLKLMDEVWVPCEDNKNNLETDGIKNVKCIPYAVDMNKYSINHQKINIGTYGNFKFYTICDLNDRKNLESIVRCFHSEFKKYEQVELIIKIHSKNTPEDVLKNIVTSKINTIKESLRIYQNNLKFYYY